MKHSTIALGALLLLAGCASNRGGDAPAAADAPDQVAAEVAEVGRPEVRYYMIADT